MIASTLRISSVFALISCFCLTASAQTGGVGGGTGGDAAGAAGAGNSTIGLPTETGAGGALTPEAAFATVERGDTVGATGETGLGFSALSVGNEGGGARTGGVGGIGGLGGFGGGGFGGLGGLGGLFGGFNNQNNQSSRPPIRTRLRSAVQVQPRSTAAIRQSAANRFRSVNQPQLGGVRVEAEGRKIILSGAVQNDRHRRMSELLMRLEPGVREIENRIEVIQPQ